MFWDDLAATEDLMSQGYAKVIDRFNKTYDRKVSLHTYHNES